MSKFIEKFYYGNIDPQARSISMSEKASKSDNIFTPVFFFWGICSPRDPCVKFILKYSPLRLLYFDTILHRVLFFE